MMADIVRPFLSWEEGGSAEVNLFRLLPELMIDSFDSEAGSIIRIM
jgi:hypothetical protein